MQVTQRFAQLLTKNVGKVIVGKEEAVELMLIARAVPRPCAHRGRAGRGQDHAGQRAGPVAGLLV